METEKDIQYIKYLMEKVFPAEGMCQHGNYKVTCVICNKKIVKNNIRVLVGMSGGVDSSVAAALLKKQGYDVVGVFLKFWSNSLNHTDVECNAEQCRRENACCNYESLVAARSVAGKLGIPFYVFDVGSEFKKEVVDYYINEYDSARTPNPCVVCNKKIKFGWMLEQAKKLGCSYIATGHYTRIGREILNPNNQIPNKSQIQNSKLETNNYRLSFDLYRLMTAKDEKKDQSYFLWQLNQDQLAHILFPVGNYTKEEVRKLAEEFGLPTAHKKESQDLCFISGDKADFLNDYAKKLTKSGDIVDLNSKVIGKHNGLCNYTIGQRENLGVQLKTDESGFIPAYVVKLNVEKNQLVVGSKEDLNCFDLVADKVNWINSNLKLKYQNSKLNKFQAKIRYGAPLADCKIVKLTKNRIKVIFDQPQIAITPGQSIVFYEDEELVGGGVIS